MQDIAELSSGMLEKLDMEDDASGVLIESNTRVFITKGQPRSVGSLEESQSTLTIISLVRSNDEGLYTCRGRNEVDNIIGTVTAASATLTVYGKQHLQGFVPK